MEKMRYRSVVIAGGLNDNVRLTRKAYVEVSQLSWFTIGVRVLKGQDDGLSEGGRMTAIMLFPFDTTMPMLFIHIPPIQRIRNREPSLLTADSICLVT